MTRFAFLLAFAAGSIVSSAQAEGFNVIEKGHALAVAADCAACHTASAGNYAGGVPLSTPFGTLLGSNITPDPETGIGGWSREQFRRAVKQGISRDGSQLYPAMPYTDYANMTDDDVDAIWAYLQTVQPVHNPVESNQLPFPFNQRFALHGWRWFNQTEGTWAPVPDKSAEWNRGRYLVMGPGHCGACHTPRNMLGGSKGGDAFLTGATLENWHAPDITPNTRTGIGSWDTAQIIAYLKTGTNDYDTASGPMAEEVARSSSQWSDADLKAVATYLKEGELGWKSAADSAKPLDPKSPSMATGQAIYNDRCNACHVTDGSGIARLYPRLAGAPLVQADDPTSIIRVVLAGSQAGATSAAPTGPVMPAFGTILNDTQVAAVADYIRNSLGNAAPKVDADAVKKLREQLSE